MLCFSNVDLLLPQHLLGTGYLVSDNGIIVDFGSGPLPEKYHKNNVIDGQGKYLSPGFVDMHTHGGGGCDFMDGTLDAMITASQMHLSHGTTSLFPTTLAGNDDSTFKMIEVFKVARKLHENMPHLQGLHLEGPYFSPIEKGAQDVRYLRDPDPRHYLPIIEHADGAIARWSLAPELPGALEMADRLVPLGIKLSMAHTAATYEDISKAFDHGMKLLTHFYSGMSTITRKGGFRILGAIEAGYLIDGLAVEIIADGKHLPPELLRLIFKCKNHEEICACTDSMRAAGMPDGPSILGSLEHGNPVIVEDGVAKVPSRSCFAGSTCTGDRMVRVLRDLAGLSLCEAVRAVSLLPARCMGIDDRFGSIEIGKQADLVMFDTDISVSRVFVDGIECVGNQGGTDAYQHDNM